MPPNEINYNEPAAEMLALDQTIRDLGVALSVGEARLQRLVAAAFSNPNLAANGIRSVMKRTGSVEQVIEIIQQNSFQRSRLFGQTREGFLFFGQRRAAREALAELPEALRDLDQLNRKQRDLQRGRELHLAHRLEDRGQRTFALRQGRRRAHSM